MELRHKRRLLQIYKGVCLLLERVRIQLLFNNILVTIMRERCDANGTLHA